MHGGKQVGGEGEGEAMAEVYQPTIMDSFFVPLI